MTGTKHPAEDLLAAIKRSGNFLESEITKHLASLGYFVESNQSIIDPYTGKSREIDLGTNSQVQLFENMNKENQNHYTKYKEQYNTSDIVVKAFY